MPLSAAQSALVDRVLRKVDAYDSPGSNILASQGEIYALLEEAARMLLLEAPMRLLRSLVTDATTAVDREVVAHGLVASAHVEVPLPTDFARLVRIQLSGWTMTRTHEDIHEDSIVTHRRYLRGEKGTTGEPVLFRVLGTGNYGKGVLTLSANVSNGDTVTIDTKTYTFQTTLTDVDGNVLIGATASATLDNLVAAIDLGSGAGTTYATSMTELTTVTAAAGPGDTLIVTVVAATTNVATTETGSTSSWGAATTTYLIQRDVIDCFPGTASTTAPVSGFEYIPDTAPESMPTGVNGCEEAMLWRAAHLLVTPFDYQLSQLCYQRSLEALAPRTMRHRSAFLVTHRPLGL